MNNSVVFRAYVTNLGLYNEGFLCGEWVDFPITYDEDIDLKEAINEVLCRTRVDGTSSFQNGRIYETGR